MTEISSATAATAPPFEPRLHVAVVAALGVRHGEQKSLRAIEEAGAQHVGAQERCQTVADAGHERDLSARVHERLRTGGRIAVDPRQRVLELEHRMMNERLRQPRDEAVADDE